MNAVLETAPDAAGDAFTFVQALAAELSSGKVDLPGFPDIVMRVQRVLSDEKADAGRIVRVLGSEPVLAGHLVQMANSAALNTTGQRITNLPTAVVRVGLDVVRSATISFAMKQMQSAPALKGLEKPLDVLWRRSVLVSSLCRVVAHRFSRVNPDEAMLAGLLQGVGRLYILTRASKHRALFADVKSYQAIERDWHLNIAAALLENWEIAEPIVEAVRDSEDFEREPRGPCNLTDILVAGTVLAAAQTDRATLETQLRVARPMARLRLTPEMCDVLLQESASEVSSLREALG